MLAKALCFRRTNGQF